MNDLPKPSSAKSIYAALIALTAWFAIVFQFYLRTGSAGNFFSFFTIECNLLIAVSLSVAGLFPHSKAGMFFSTLNFQTACTLYIGLVALVYNTVLRGLVPLAGATLLADTLLHVIVPLLYLLYWIFFRPAGSLEYGAGLYWAIFPFLYLLYSLLRGSIVNWYPYPFLNADKYGYGQVLINAVIVTTGFLIGGVLLIAVTKKKSR